MTTYPDADARRPIIIYIIVAIVLFAALILGIRWAKSRSAYYAQLQSGQSQPVAQGGGQQTNTPSGQAPPQSQPKPAGSPSQNSSSTAENSTIPTQVPSTGAEDFIAPIISLSLIAFSATSYIRARKRLLALARV